MASIQVRTLVLCFALVCAAADAHAQRAIVIVRHAERADESKDSPLSSAGTTRAESLARLLASSGITAVYTTQLQRTIKTAEPLAKRLGLAVTSTDVSTAELVQMLRASHPDGTVLVVGHSNTVPEILAELGHKDAITIAADEYDNLFVVVPRTGQPPAVIRFRY
jgi:broad specificity phosphatase PhoE